MTALLTFKVRLSGNPSYLADLLQLRTYTRSLRSAEAPVPTTPRTQTALATRAFYVAVPTVWNALPAGVRSIDSVATFKRNLKTHFFTVAYT